MRQREYDRQKEGKANSSNKKTTTIYMLRQIKRVSKFWREYCGKIAVEKIDNAVLQDYIGWRKDYYSNFDKDSLPKNVRATLNNPSLSTSRSHVPA